MVHENENNSEPNQIFSLEQGGLIHMWTIFRSAICGQKSKHYTTVDLGQSYWGDVRLILVKRLRVNSASRSLDLECTCMTVFNQDIFVGTSKGVVQHLSSTSSTSIPNSYLSNTEELLSVKCIEHCPYDKEYFLVGFSNGQIKMYNRKREKPLISFAGTGNPNDPAVDVRYICWSKHRLGLFFVLDSDARLHLWDLCKSDMYPLYSISLQFAKVTNLDLSPYFDRNAVQSSFLVLGTSSGHVEVHRIRKELGKQSDAEFKKDRNKFMKYVSIL
uniref:WD repeat-containing protein 60 n=1 Tax=Cacopsylla melanoneura TaxID=428564 RepID=A0A8D9B528_9HEMI